MNENVEYHAILIHGTPKIVLDSLNTNEHLIHVPFIARTRPAAAHAVGETLAEFLAPAPHGLMRDDHAPFRQDQLNVPEAEAEDVVESDGVADDLGRKAVAVMRVGWRLHPASFAGFGLPGQTELP